MSKTNIILTGFMGTGKTTVGIRLAEKLGWTFVDTDALIEQQAGQTIAELFATQGEKAFRQKETELAEKLSMKKNLVIATGGGLILNPTNVAILKQTGHIFCLTAPPTEILERVKRQKHIRPLLQDTDPLKKITDLLQQRDYIYQLFSQIPTTGLTPDELAEKILDKLKLME